ncbi:DNA polymerase domain-containing protein [Nocardioides sp. Kera G14]|uniref:DNA polymerase domain-containing protein n=1 Tax=Nocardioides sp. Kera G14 TaxID=2884264 RepID=UPI001D11E95C|nr:DNA primase small subunit domain-containing protein [Nocardioides sp. Kera G14]UDY23017.1 ATP-dependent DNA ligase [Nocardioides sp. Kera G14]
MAKRDDAAYLSVGEREVRISSPGRVIYEATERTPEVTKLMVAEYYATVGDPMMRSIGLRPCALERWPDGWREGMQLATPIRDGRPEYHGPKATAGDGFFQKVLPKGAPDYVETAHVTFPSGRTQDELCPTEPAALVWAAQMGTLTFHPWPVRRGPDAASLDHPDELRLDFDPYGATGFADAKRVAVAARELLAELGVTGYLKTSGNRGLHLYVRIEPAHSFEDVRHAAIGIGQELSRRDPDGVTVNWWKEERGDRIFIDFNQNNRDRTIASAYSLRAKSGAPVSTPITWDELESLADPKELNLVTVPPLVSERDPWQGMDDVHHDLEPLMALWDGVETNFPPDYPKMPGEPPRVQPSKKRADHWDDEGNRIGT